MNYKEYFSEHISDEEILRAFNIVLPYLNDLTRDDTAYALMNTKQYIYYEAAKGFDVNIKYGDKIDIIGERCLNSGEIQRIDIPENLYGRKIKTVAIPIRNSKGQVVGVVANAIDMESVDQLMTSVKEITIFLI